MTAKRAKPVYKSNDKDKKDNPALRAIFMQKLTQALKTKTGALQTAAVRRIFHLAVRSLPDEELAKLSLQLDYTPRGMQSAYYVNVAEGVIVKLAERGSVANRGAGLAWLGRHPERETDRSIEEKTHSPENLATIMERILWLRGFLGA